MQLHLYLTHSANSFFWNTLPKNYDGLPYYKNVSVIFLIVQSTKIEKLRDI